MITLKTPSEILAALKDAETIAATCIDAIPASTRPAWEMNIATAKASIESLKRQYADAILRRAKGVFPTGTPENVQEYVAEAKRNGQAIEVDAQEFYKVIAMAVEPTLGARREFTSNQTMMVQALVDKAIFEAGGGRSPLLRLSGVDVVPTFDSLVQKIQILVREGSGDAINTQFLRTKISLIALENKIDTDDCTILVTNTAEHDRLSLSPLFQTTQTVDADNASFAIDAFKDSAKAKPFEPKFSKKPTKPTKKED